MHTIYIDFRKCTLCIFISLEIYNHMRIFQHVIKGYRQCWYDYKLPHDYKFLM